MKRFLEVLILRSKFSEIIVLFSNARRSMSAQVVLLIEDAVKLAKEKGKISDFIPKGD